MTGRDSKRFLQWTRTENPIWRCMSTATWKREAPRTVGEMPSRASKSSETFLRTTWLITVTAKNDARRTWIFKEANWAEPEETRPAAIKPLSISTMTLRNTVYVKIRKFYNSFPILVNTKIPRGSRHTCHTRTGKVISSLRCRRLNHYKRKYLILLLFFRKRLKLLALNAWSSR